MEPEDSVELYYAALARLLTRLRAAASHPDDPRWDELDALVSSRHGYPLGHLVLYGAVAPGVRDRARRLFLSLWDAARTTDYPKRAWLALEGAIFGPLNRYSDASVAADFATQEERS